MVLEQDASPQGTKYKHVKGYTDRKIKEKKVISCFNIHIVLKIWAQLFKANDVVS